jgi:hypothetical protein
MGTRHRCPKAGRDPIVEVSSDLPEASRVRPPAHPASTNCVAGTDAGSVAVSAVGAVSGAGSGGVETAG